MQPRLFARKGKCQAGNRIMLNASPALQAIDPLHNIYFRHSSSSFLPFRTVKSSICKTQAQVIGLKLINSPRLSVCVSAISELSAAANNKNNTPSLFVHKLGGTGNRLDYHRMFKRSMLLQSGTQAGINEMDYSQGKSDMSSEEQPRAHRNRISTLDGQTPCDVREPKQNREDRRVGRAGGGGGL